MSGIVKGIKKIFKKVVSFVKKALPIILMAAAVYFTAGLALSAFPATASFAASLPGFAGGGFLGLGVGAGATAGTGIFTHAAASLGLATLGSGGGLVGGALAAGTSMGALGAAGVGAEALATGATEAAGAGLIAGIPAGTAALIGAGTQAAALAGGLGGAGAGVAGGGTAAGLVSTKAGLTIGEKLLLASTGVQALGALSAPKPGDERKFRGSFYGMDRKGQGGAIVPGSEGPPAGQPPVGEAPVGPQEDPNAPQPQAATTPKSGDLFAQGQQLGTSVPQRMGSKFQQQSPDLFQPMAGVRYVS